MYTTRSHVHHTHASHTAFLHLCQSRFLFSLLLVILPLCSPTVMLHTHTHTPHIPMLLLSVASPTPSMPQACQLLLPGIHAPLYTHAPLHSCSAFVTKMYHTSMLPYTPCLAYAFDYHGTHMLPTHPCFIFVGSYQHTPMLRPFRELHLHIHDPTRFPSSSVAVTTDAPSS